MSNIRRLLQSLARQHTGLPNPGDVFHDTGGFQGISDAERWVFARITAGPSASGGTGAYSWVELIPLPGGTGATAGEGGGGLSGTGGTGGVLSNPAYAWGGATFAVGDEVILLRG